MSIRSFTQHNQKRALEVLQCAADGLSVDRTAQQLNYTAHSVKLYRRLAISIFDASDITQAVAEALRRGYIK